MKGIIMNNCIFDGRGDNSIGFFNDLKSGLEKQASEYVERGEHEQASDIYELLKDLMEYGDFTGLLVISENNGMGWTVSKYSEWAQNNEYEI